MGGYFTNCQCGSFIVSQWRNALSRQSVSHCGSFFLAEIRRMMSSFKPGGADSVSTSVTKPYLYSCLTRLSIVSVAVLIVKMVNSLNGVSGHPVPCIVLCRLF